MNYCQEKAASSYSCVLSIMKCCDWYTSYLFPLVFTEKLWINFTGLKIYSQIFNNKSY